MIYRSTTTLITHKFTIIILLLIITAGCKSSKDGDSVLVRFRDYELTLDEVNFHIPKNISGDDSARYAKLYIEQWKMEHSLMEAAKERISNIDEKIEYKVRDYRRKMIVDELHHFLIKNNPPPTVSDMEAEKYYKDNIQQFISGGNMYWYAYIKSSDPQVQQINNQIISPNVNERSALLDWCKKHAEEYKLDDRYVSAQELGYLSELVKNDLGKIIPNSSPSLFITNDEDGKIKYHLFFMRDVIKSGKYIPFGSVKKEIKKVIQIRKQTAQIEQFEANTFEQAQAAKEFKGGD